MGGCGCVEQAYFTPIEPPPESFLVPANATLLCLREPTDAEVAAAEKVQGKREPPSDDDGDDDDHNYTVVVEPVFDDAVITAVPEVAASYATFARLHAEWSAEKDSHFVNWIQQRVYKYVAV